MIYLYEQISYLDIKTFSLFTYS